VLKEGLIAESTEGRSRAYAPPAAAALAPGRTRPHSPDPSTLEDGLLRLSKSKERQKVRLLN